MTDPWVEERLGFAERRRLVAARTAALFVDTLLVAYAVWCINFITAHQAGEIGREDWLFGTAGFLGRRPWLLLLAPLVAVIWEAAGQSLGQRAYRVEILGTAGQPAGANRSAWRAVLVALQVVVVLVPLVLAGGPHLLLSALLLLAFGAAGFVDPHGGRGLADRLAGTRTGRRSPSLTGRVRPWWQRPTPWIILGLLGLTAAVGLRLTDFHPLELITNVKRTQHLFSRLFSPDWSITAAVIEKMVETVFLALMASVLALPFAFVLSFLGARNVMTKTPLGSVVYVLARVLMNVTRSIEPIVWVIIFSLWVGVGPAAGMLALFIHSVAALGKLYSEAVESIDRGPVEAIQATGANALQVLRYAVVPQVVPPFLSFTVYRWDINVRMATILGLVGGGGIGMMLIDFQQLGAWSKVGTIIVFVTLVVWAMDWASSKAREKLM